MATIQIELPDETAKAVEQAGLLTPEMVDRVFSRALDRMHAASDFLSVAERLAALGVPEMSMDEIVAEVKAVRAERRHRASGC